MNNLSEAYWMPFTARNGFRKEPRVIVGAQGCHYTCLLYTSDAADE